MFQCTLWSSFNLKPAASLLNEWMHEWMNEEFYRMRTICLKTILILWLYRFSNYFSRSCVSCKWLFACGLQFIVTTWFLRNYLRSRLIEWFLIYSVDCWHCCWNFMQDRLKLELKFRSISLICKRIAAILSQRVWASTHIPMPYFPNFQPWENEKTNKPDYLIMPFQPTTLTLLWKVFISEGKSFYLFASFLSSSKKRASKQASRGEKMNQLIYDICVGRSA